VARWDWLGVREKRWTKEANEEIRPAKTAWDWLQLAVVPAMLAVIAIGFNEAQSNSDQARQARQFARDQEVAAAARMDATLDAYFVDMNRLVLDRHLLTSKSESPVRHVAHSLTLTALHRLDGVRKGAVLRYLAEGQLVTGTPCSKSDCVETGPVSLAGADLRNADLRHAQLLYLDLSGADFRGALFDSSVLEGTSLVVADVRGASFRAAEIDGSTFGEADLSRAVFDRAILADDQPDPTSPRFLQTSFENACLNGTRFVGATFMAAGVVTSRGGIATNGNAVTFHGAAGNNLDLTRAGNLASTDMTDASFPGARLQGTSGRPKGWRPAHGRATCPPH